MNINKKSIIIIFIGISSLCNCQNKDIYPKINLKIGFSLNRVFQIGEKVMLFTTNNYSYGVCTNEKFYLKPNLRIEADYFITKWLEFGIYGGYFEYNAYDVIIEDTLANVSQIKTYAPTFGINCNFHILKLLFYPKLKKLDLYFIFKYGGTILPKWGGDYEYAISNIFADPIFSKYRSSYCFGLGGTYSFWKKMGVYSELTFGKHSYFPDIDLKSHIAFRAGVVLSL